jgi:hypothetical protein
MNDVHHSDEAFAALRAHARHVAEQLLASSVPFDSYVSQAANSGNASVPAAPEQRTSIEGWIVLSQLSSEDLTSTENSTLFEGVHQEVWLLASGELELAYPAVKRVNAWATASLDRFGLSASSAAELDYRTEWREERSEAAGGRTIIKEWRATLADLAYEAPYGRLTRELDDLLSRLT